MGGEEDGRFFCVFRYGPALWLVGEVEDDDSALAAVLAKIGEEAGWRGEGLVAALIEGGGLLAEGD